jgi:hypothetical protein
MPIRALYCDNRPSDQSKLAQQFDTRLIGKLEINFLAECRLSILAGGDAILSREAGKALNRIPKS